MNAKRRGSDSQSNAKRSTSKRASTSSSRSPGRKGNSTFGQFLRHPVFVISTTMFALAGLTLLIGALAYQSFHKRDVILEEAPARFHISRGTSVWGVYRNLVGDGVIERSIWFPFWISRAELDCIQAGTHTLPDHATPEELFALLCEPTAGAGVRVTIPEGSNIWQIADRLQAQGLASRSAFIEVAQRPQRVALYDLETPTAEGLLFPDTWEFETGVRPETIVERMVARFVDQWRELNEAHPDALGTLRETFGIGMYEAIIIASIVEKEAVVDEERPIIARVIYNRLERGMRIQCDPTCVYGPDIYDERPSPATCRDPESVYSTYVIDGLPPTPIANPGAASLRAALLPAEDDEVLYFVSRMDGSGRHVFAGSLQEHNRNVQRYLRNND